MAIREIFIQRVKYSDLCVRKNSSGKDYGMPERSNAGVRPLTRLRESLGPNRTPGKVKRRRVLKSMKSQNHLDCSLVLNKQ